MAVWAERVGRVGESEEFGRGSKRDKIARDMNIYKHILMIDDNSSYYDIIILRN